MIEVVFQPYGARALVPQGATILEAALKAGVGIRSVCGGRGNCGKCRVIVVKGNVETIHRGKERELLTEDEVRQGHVLACLAKVIGSCEVFIPPESRFGRAKLLTEALIPRVTPEPYTYKIYLDSGKVRDLQILLRSKGITVEQCIERRIAEYFDELLIDGATLTLNNYRKLNLIDVDPGDSRDKLYGLAIDIGTTKIVVALVNIASGKIIDVESEFNRQLIYGEDLVSRIAHVMDRAEGLRELQKAVVDTVNNIVAAFTRRHGVRARDIYEVSAAGNTVMTYLFIGLNPYQLIKSFKERVDIPREPYVLSAREIGLSINESADVYVLPCSGRFLGGDVIGDIIASGMSFSNNPSFLIDIGTNIEVVLGCRNWFIGTTGAAGPAFEGWGLRCGLRAVEGAIESVKIDQQTLKPSYSVIGGTKPRGVCGSGYIDLLAELFRHGAVDSLGKFSRDTKSPYIRKGPEGYEYVVVPAEESDTNRDIVITEKDIANLIDSKSAACAAISILLKKMKLSVHDVSRVYVCGAFGKYLNISSAIAIGMIPEFPKAEIVYIGNGSLAGAYLALISRGYREEAERVARLISSIDLMSDPDFMDEYLSGFIMPGKKELFPTWWEVSRRIKRL
ncbi:MAG: ASKHA domain-containing protein [Sulfolobales archaeon]|nr:ASKHA domain-containing protein [Sulfolobales archaeon]